MEGFVKNAPDLDAPTGYGADLMLAPEKMALVTGVRYETFGFKKSGPASISGTAVTTSTELKGSRATALVGYRFLSTPKAYGGVLAHYGLAQKLKYTMSSVNGGGATSVSSYEFKMDPSYGLAVEGGSRFGRVLIGGEVGYTIFKAKYASDDIGVVLDKNLNAVKLDLSGTYFKLLIGARF